ncbi:hypothetical protein FRC12_009570 [Ceratobasidium sp. 428]|nr:hypothetical protein FRC12_009570 [Ceratobasidium sp. 428]
MSYHLEPVPLNDSPQNATYKYPKSEYITTHGTLWMMVIGLAIIYSSFGSLKAPLRFIWHCFLRPLGGAKTQQDRLDQFYEGQADIYDSTRRKLLRGRKTMLALTAAHLRERKTTQKPLVWVDIGGGTGKFNVFPGKFGGQYA